MSDIKAICNGSSFGFQTPHAPIEFTARIHAGVNLHELIAQQCPVCALRTELSTETRALYTKIALLEMQHEQLQPMLDWWKKSQVVEDALTVPEAEEDVPF